MRLSFVSLAVLLSLTLAACSVAPTYLSHKGADGSSLEVLTGGISILTSSDRESSYVRKGDLEMRHTVVKKDETAVPRYGFWGEVIPRGIEALEPVTEGAGTALENISAP